jgi:glycine C-acetyltransferase
LEDLGYEVIKGEHPIVPLMVRDTQKTTELVAYLKENGILATGLNFPVVPKGDQEIRFEICADHTESDINYALQVLRKYKETH